MTVRPAKTQISLGYPLSAQRRLWSDWADAQADLSRRWAHTHFIGFVVSRLKYYYYYLVFTIQLPYNPIGDRWQVNFYRNPIDLNVVLV